MQAALNAAQPGDEIVLAAGARFTGTFRLPVKPFGAVITIRSSRALPARRLTPADAPLLPVIVSGGVESALTATGTSNWRLDGLQFESSTTGEGNIIDLQDATAITMDRLLIVAGPAGQKRAIKGNGRQITLTRSHIANIWRAGQDSQAFCAWDGAGPYTITDNYLEAASENVMFGGANSLAADRVPSDILVVGNHFSKPLEWRGQGKAVKNLFELKSAKRVTVRGNVFERNWTDGQSGTAIVFTVRNDEGGAPWSVLEDVLFEQNIVRDTEGVFNILGYDSYQPSGRATRITIRNNLAVGTGFFLQAGGEVGDADRGSQHRGSGAELPHALYRRRVAGGHGRAARGPVCRRVADGHEQSRESQRVRSLRQWRWHRHAGPRGADPQLSMDIQRVGGRLGLPVSGGHVAAHRGRAPRAVQCRLLARAHEHVSRSGYRQARSRRLNGRHFDDDPTYSAGIAHPDLSLRDPPLVR